MLPWLSQKSCCQEPKGVIVSSQVGGMSARDKEAPFCRESIKGLGAADTKITENDHCAGASLVFLFIP